MDRSISTILIVLLVMAVFTAIATILSTVYSTRKLNYFGQEAMQKTLYPVAYRLVTGNMSFVQVYDEQYGGVKPAIEQKIQKKINDIGSLYTSESFVESMKNRGVVGQDMKIQADMCAFVGTAVYAKLIRENPDEAGSSQISIPHSE